MIIVKDLNRSKNKDAQMKETWRLLKGVLGGAQHKTYVGYTK